MFGARDLALFLPDKAGDAHSLRHTELNEEEIFEPLKPKIDNSKKVVRYFPGKAPIWLDDGAISSSFVTSSSSEVKNDTNINSTLDRRLQRINKSNEPVSNRGRRRIYEAEVIVDSENHNEEINEPFKTNDQEDDFIMNEDDDEDEEDIVARRNRIKSKMQSIEKSRDSVAQSSSSSSHPSTMTHNNNSESEYETDSDESSEEDTKMKKPVFVPRNNRETLKEQERKIEVQLELEKQKSIQEQGRKQQTREMVADSIRRNEESAFANLNQDNDEGRPDDTDEPDDDDEEVIKILSQYSATFILFPPQYLECIF